jgi:hypothetical protein
MEKGFTKMSWLFLNIIMVPLMLFAAKMSFDDGNIKTGFFDLFAAALNFIAAASYLAS